MKFLHAYYEKMECEVVGGGWKNMVHLLFLFVVLERLSFTICVFSEILGLLKDPEINL